MVGDLCRTLLLGPYYKAAFHFQHIPVSIRLYAKKIVPSA